MSQCHEHTYDTRSTRSCTDRSFFNKKKGKMLTGSVYTAGFSEQRALHSLNGNDNRTGFYFDYPQIEK